MKQLIWKIIFPISVISFTIFTKWWYVLPTDAPDTMMVGFPLICISDGWHTSGSLQIFVIELTLNFLLYFLFWFLTFYCINRFLIKVKIHRFLAGISLTLSGLIIVGAIMIGNMSEHIYKTNRNFEIEVLTTGYKFIWEHQERPDFKNYDTKKK